MDSNNKTNSDLLIPEFVSPPSAPSKKPGTTPKLFKSPHPPVRYSPNRRSPVQSAAAKSRKSPIKSNAAAGDSPTRVVSSRTTTNFKTRQTNLNAGSASSAVSPSKIVAKKFFASPIQRSTKSTGSENLTPQSSACVSPQIFVSPPTPKRTSSGPLRSIINVESKPSRSLSSERSRSRSPTVTMTSSSSYVVAESATGRWKSVENLARKSDLIPLTARRRSSTLNPTNNGLVRKEFSNYAVQIGVRVRPFIAKRHSLPVTSKAGPEINAGCVVENRQPGTVVVKNNEQSLTFNFEHVFSDVTNYDHPDAAALSLHSLAKQEKVYVEMARPLVEALVDGYNCCFLAYGQTGSGKTYSTMGPGDCPGIVPRFCKDLFHLLEKDTKANSWVLEVGYYEIYNEKIRDLLITDTEHHAQLKIREHPETGPFIDNLGCFPVRTYEMIQSWMDFGNKQRATSATFKNDQSSRSHAIFLLKLTQKYAEVVEGSQKDYTRISSAYLVDLAGSERACTSLDLKETSSINKSLSCLGKVILQLAEKKQQYINYRDSTLTWLLKEYLGGNAKTSMLVTVSPSEVDVEETVSTLRYAHQARAIVNRVCINEDPAITAIKKYKQEIESLKRQLDSFGNNGLSAASNDKNEDILELKRELKILTEKLRETETRRLEDNESFEVRLSKSREAQKTTNFQCRLSLFDSTVRVVPGKCYIALLSGDALVSQSTFYDFNENHDLVIGSAEYCEIRLENATVPPKVCCISFNGRHIWLIRRNDDNGVKVRVNGEDIGDTKVLANGDYLNVCGEYFFRIWIPQSAHDSLSNAVEFEKAKSQLLSVQNAKLEEAMARRSTELKTEYEKHFQRVKSENDLAIEKMQKNYEEKIASLEHLLIEEKSAVSNKSKMQDIKTRRSSLLIEVNEAKQDLDETVIFRSELLLEIENLYKQYSPPPFSYKKRSSIARRSSLLSTEQLVNEANMLLRDWKKQFEFSYEESYDDENRCKHLMIRLTNTKLLISTLLSISEFRQRVELLRSLYESGHITAPKLEKVLMNANDKWESVNGPDSGLYSIAVINSLKLAKRRSSFAINNRRDSLSPRSMRKSSFLLNYTFGEKNVLDQIVENPVVDGFKLLSTCFQNACSNGNCLNVETVIDSAIETCNAALLSIKSINEDKSVENVVNFGSTLIRCYWSFMMCGLWDFIAVEDLSNVKDEFVERVDVTNATIRLIFKTMDDTEGVKRELCQKLEKQLIDLCYSYGSATFLLPTKPIVHCLQSCRKCKIDSELLASFVKGFCQSYLWKREKTLNRILHLENGCLSVTSVKAYRIANDCFMSLEKLLPLLENGGFKNGDDLASFCCNILYAFVHGLAAFGSQRADPTFLTNLIRDTQCLVNGFEISEQIKDMLSTFIEKLIVLESV